MQLVMGGHLFCQDMTFVNGISAISYLESMTFLWAECSSVWGVSACEFSKVTSVH
jgi:hypothetical protein